MKTNMKSVVLAVVVLGGFVVGFMGGLKTLEASNPASKSETVSWAVPEPTITMPETTIVGEPVGTLIMDEVEIVGKRP